MIRDNDEGRIIAKDKRIRRRKQLAIRIFICIAGVVVIMAGSAYGAGRIMMHTGYKSLREKTGSVPTITMENYDNQGSTGYEWRDGWVRFNGEVYAYNEDIISFLVMGIDKKTYVTDNSSLTDGG